MAFDQVVIFPPLAERRHDLCIEESACHLSLDLNMTFGTIVRSRETSRHICIDGLKFDFTARKFFCIYLYIKVLIIGNGSEHDSPMVLQRITPVFKTLTLPLSL